MNKIIVPSNHDELVLRSGRLSTFFESDSQLIKNAASSAFSEAMIRNHAPDDDHFGVHLIAMGAGEFYSFNKNGDWWTKEGLIKYHPTFVSHGNLFREHLNQDPKKRIGVVKASAYNLEMERVELVVWGDKRKAEKEYARAKTGKELAFSMSARVPYDKCLPAGSLIHTASGWRPIEQIQVGDMVWTHKSRLRNVTQLFNSSDKLGKCIQFGFFNFPLSVTGNHPVLALVRGQATNNQVNYIRKEVDEDSGNVVGLIGWNKPEMVEADKLQAGDYALAPASCGAALPELPAWLLGLYLADGCILGERRNRDHSGEWRAYGVSWTLGYAKDGVRHRLKNLLTELGLAYKEHHDPERHCYVVNCWSAEFAAKVMAVCGRTKDKHVPDDFPNWTKQALVEFLAGWLDGDGSQDQDKQTIRGSSHNYELALTMLQVAFRARLPAGFQEGDAIGDWSKEGAKYWSLHFSTQASAVLAASATRYVVPEDQHPGKSFIVWCDGIPYVAIRISKITDASFPETFNFSVEEDETYIVGNIVTHNCSACGNKAKKSKDYCPHLKHTMTQWLPKFSKFAYAINDIETFFDISVVENPADRIALYIEYVFGKDDGLQKAASTSFLFSDDMATAEGMEEKITGCVDETKQAWLRKLASHETYLQACTHNPDNVAKDAKFHFVKQAAKYAFDDTAFTEAQMQAIRKFEPDVLFYHLAKRATMLPFLPFYALATKQTIKEASADSAFRYARENVLPTIFNTMLQSPAEPKLENLFDAALSFKAAAFVPDDPIESLLKKVDEDFSVEQPVLRVRIMRICASQPPQLVEKAASHSEISVSDAQKQNAFRLAKSYGLYKVALCQAMNDMHGEETVDDALALLLIYPHQN